MYYTGQLIRIHPKLATLPGGHYLNTTGERLDDNTLDEVHWEDRTYFNPEMRKLANTIVTVDIDDTDHNRIDVDGSSGYWTLLYHWVHPTQTLKEL